MSATNGRHKAHSNPSQPPPRGTGRPRAGTASVTPSHPAVGGNSFSQGQPARTAPTIVMREDGQYVFFPPVPALADVFRTARHRPIDKAAGGVWVAAKAEPLVWESSGPYGPSLNCFRGLAPLVEAELLRRGYKVVWRRKPLAAFPAPEPADAADPALLRYVHGRERGIVRYGPGVRVERLVAEISAVSPTLRFLVVVTRKADVWRVHDALVAAGVAGVGWMTPRHTQPAADRVIVATPAVLGHGCATIEHRHLCLALDPAELFSAGAMHFGVCAIKALLRARLFGFLPAARRLEPLRRDFVRALFGADELVVPAHGFTRRPVRAVFVTVGGGPRPAADDGVYPVVRDAVHANGLRNRLVGQLVKALTSSDRSGLAARYPAVAPLVANRLCRVAVYADNAGHGLRLAHHLRLPLVVNTLTDGDTLTPADLLALDRGAEYRDHATQPVVVTTGGLRHLGRVDVVVRADAGVGALPLPARHLRNPAGDDRGLVVIDFKDADTPLLRHRSRRRAEAYRAAGWDVAGDPVLSPLERFKADRPDVVR